MNTLQALPPPKDLGRGPGYWEGSWSLSFFSFTINPPPCSLYSIDWLAFITDTVCLLRCTSWIFKYNSGSFSSLQGESSIQHPMTWSVVRSVKVVRLLAFELATAHASNPAIFYGRAGWACIVLLAAEKSAVSCEQWQWRKVRYFWRSVADFIFIIVRKYVFCIVICVAKRPQNYRLVW